ncbi:MAG: hypothetical protein KDD94_01815 [Calditrichaeota bacterium]|nr:hypothetical protein [Calditrichota bacterium]
MWLILLIWSLVFGDTQVKLSSKPSKSGSIRLTQLARLTNNDEGYYSSVLSTVMENGNIVVLDRGNTIIYVYDQGGKELYKFGKEGSGPGEISRPMNIFSAYNQIFVQEDLKTHIYKINGEHIADVNLLIAGQQALLLENNNKIFAQQLRHETGKYLFGIMKADGSIGDFVENPNYNSDNDRNTRYYTSLVDYIITDKGIYSKDKGDYKFVFSDLKFQPVKTFTRPFDRVERKDDEYGVVRISQGDMSKSEHAKKEAAANAALRKEMGKYHDDIRTFVGIDNQRLFIEVKSDNDKLMKIDVIENDQYIDQLQIPHEGKYPQALIKNGLLLINDRNDDIGPFVTVYRVN